MFNNLVTTYIIREDFPGDQEVGYETCLLEINVIYLLFRLLD